MSKKFIPYEKMSKRKEKEINKSKRTLWDFPPIEKIIPDKRYSEKKKKWIKNIKLLLLQL